MNKYQVYLADNYKSPMPFMVDWDCELIGDALREEFEEYFAKQEKIAGAGMGKTKQLFKGEYVKKFMILKRINIVDDPGNNTLKSVFILRKGEKKVIDGRAKDSLAPRFEYKVKIASDGTKGEPTGFLKFDLIEGEEKKEAQEAVDLKVTGNDIQYFEGEDKVESPEVVEETKSDFVCAECGKEFKNARALHMHSLSHKKK